MSANIRINEQVYICQKTTASNISRNIIKKPWPFKKTILPFRLLQHESYNIITRITQNPAINHITMSTPSKGTSKLIFSTRNVQYIIHTFWQNDNNTLWHSTTLHLPSRKHHNWKCLKSHNLILPVKSQHLATCPFPVNNSIKYLQKMQSIIFISKSTHIIY